MLIKAYAKINITLDVVGKREDGYHNLKMIMQQVDVYDIIDIDKCEEGISISCSESNIPCDERNLAYKAARLFMDKYDIRSGVTINITKNIPVEAGLAGGSSDAAAVLKAMRALFNIHASDKELMELGVKIGADVPYCIQGGTALCEGIGEIITPLKSFKDKIIVLIKPNFGVSTKDIFKSLHIDELFEHPNTEEIIKYMEKGNLKEVCMGMKNLLETVTLKKHHAIVDIKNDMINLGALGSMMSGSGPSVFGFFDDMLLAQKCYDKFKECYKEVFLTRTI
jgi:4-diphosphocytidyl-2-C-methyl-D-erythritol kinase